MQTLPQALRRKLESAVEDARDIAEAGAEAALKHLAVHSAEPDKHLSPDERKLRNRLRTHGRQLGDMRESTGKQTIRRLTDECAYAHWHRMLFARFLADNGLLMHPDGVAVTLVDCDEIAEQEKASSGWEIAGRYASKMLPQIFRPDAAELALALPPEHEKKLEHLLSGLAPETFQAADSLGWVYQFWQVKRKEDVNESEVKIGADELPAVTQLFTEDYMVFFLLHNTLGAWWAGKRLAADPALAKTAQSEDELRQACSLPEVDWRYLRFARSGEDGWRPAAGVFDGWPPTASELRVLDPCMGSGHFLVFALPLLARMRMAEEKLSETESVVAVLRDNLFGLELDPRCTQLAAFNLAFAAWRAVGFRLLPALHLACSGLSPNARKDDWLRLAGKHYKAERGMNSLYELFKDGPTLGSLINPHKSGGDLLSSGFRDLQPLFVKALGADKAGNDDDNELGVRAEGLAKAAEVLASKFTLVATNVPYLGRGKQDDLLKAYCEDVHPDAKADLATCFIERALEFCAPGGSTALVTPQTWLFLGAYEGLRRSILSSVSWMGVIRLGARAFETISGEVVNVALLIHSRSAPHKDNTFFGVDVSAMKDASDKRARLQTEPVALVSQRSQLNNPDARIIHREGGTGGKRLLSEKAVAYQGLITGDRNSYIFRFWEIPSIADDWEPFADGYSGNGVPLGRENVIFWESGRGRLYSMAAENRERLHDMHESGNLCWGKKGVLLTRIGLRATPYYGERYDNNLICITPRDGTDLRALWNFCSSVSYREAVRELDQKLSLTNATACKVAVDLTDWAEPGDLPPARSLDPTQWLFSGHPKGGEETLQVAVARLLGYRWPRQTGSNFVDCHALHSDGLERLADDDGIVCLSAIRQEEPASERLRILLAAAFGSEWTTGKHDELLREVDYAGKTLEEWLRNGFFAQHCKLFHERPFIWQIWDGVKRDGFSALVNYHKLDKKLLETLTYSYLGDWIKQQQDDLARKADGAAERLGAARALQKKLELILAGDEPLDVFVRWKPLDEQPTGWEPDLNDGVRVNIRPFMYAGDVGASGAGVLRTKPNINWNKDRGQDPTSAPWYPVFKGDRINDHHLGLEEKRRAREKKQGKR